MSAMRRTFMWLTGNREHPIRVDSYDDIEMRGDSEAWRKAVAVSFETQGVYGATELPVTGRRRSYSQLRSAPFERKMR